MLGSSFFVGVFLTFCDGELLRMQFRLFSHFLLLRSRFVADFAHDIVSKNCFFRVSEMTDY